MVRTILEKFEEDKTYTYSGLKLRVHSIYELADRRRISKVDKEGHSRTSSLRYF